MRYPTLKHFNNTNHLGGTQQLRTQVSTAEDVPSLLAAAYADGIDYGIDFWAAAAIDYPSPTVWFHTKLPLEAQLLKQQTAEINRQVGLVRSYGSSSPVMIFQAQPMVNMAHVDGVSVQGEVAYYRDFIVFSGAHPQALVRVGALSSDSAPSYEELAPLVELVGANVSVIAHRSASVETVKFVAGCQDLPICEFFELLEMVLAEVNELSLVVVEINIDDDGAEQSFDDHHWQQLWGLLQDSLGEMDLSCHLQRGRYVVAMPSSNSQETLIAADRLRGRLEDLGRSCGVKLTVTIGIGNWTAGAPSGGELLWQARQAMGIAAACHAKAPFVYPWQLLQQLLSKPADG